MRAVVRATRTFFSLALPYFRSEDRWIAGALLTGILVAELGLVAILVAINEWNKRFFNALESRDWNAAQFELIVFCVIALAAVVAGMAQFFLGQRLIIRWRRWITDRYVSMWMANGRHYRVRLVDPSVDNIHLRIASDVLIFLHAHARAVHVAGRQHRHHLLVRRHPLVPVGGDAAAAVRPRPRRFPAG